jgi:hypothetical protein
LHRSLRGSLINPAHTKSILRLALILAEAASLALKSAGSGKGTEVPDETAILRADSISRWVKPHISAEDCRVQSRNEKPGVVPRRWESFHVLLLTFQIPNNIVKIPSSFPLLTLIAVIGPVALVQSGCTKNDATAPLTGQNTNANATDVAVDAPISDSWARIKDYTYERRVEFTASFDRMTARMDDKTREMQAKVANIPDDAAKDRDHAMNDLSEARTDLKSRLTDLGNATAATWADAKEKVGQAWQKVNAAFDKATSSSTPAVASNR